MVVDVLRVAEGFSSPVETSILGIPMDSFVCELSQSDKACEKAGNESDIKKPN